jgi:hypothetical protein
MQIAATMTVAGVLGLARGSFSYTKETHEAKIGPLELSLKDKQTVNVPVLIGVGVEHYYRQLLEPSGRSPSPHPSG